MSDPASVPLVPAAMLHALTVAHAEIDRLRLTEAEREALERELRQAEYQRRDDLAAILRGLLERMGGGG